MQMYLTIWIKALYVDFVGIVGYPIHDCICQSILYGIA